VKRPIDYDIKNGMYITNTTFSHESEIFATENNIKLWDGDKLSKLFFSMIVGGSVAPNLVPENERRTTTFSL